MMVVEMQVESATVVSRPAAGKEVATELERAVEQLPAAVLAPGRVVELLPAVEEARLSAKDVVSPVDIPAGAESLPEVAAVQ